MDPRATIVDVFIHHSWEDISIVLLWQNGWGRERSPSKIARRSKHNRNIKETIVVASAEDGFKEDSIRKVGQALNFWRIRWQKSSANSPLVEAYNAVPIVCSRVPPPGRRRRHQQRQNCSARPRARSAPASYATVGLSGSRWKRNITPGCWWHAGIIIIVIHHSEHFSELSCATDYWNTLISHPGPLFRHRIGRDNPVVARFPTSMTSLNSN